MHHRKIVARLGAAVCTLLLGALLAGTVHGPVSSQEPYRVLQPAGSGPFPAVLFISGCSGFVPFGEVNTYDERAEELRQSGLVVLYVDYLRKRGFATCAGNIDLATVGQDVIDAAGWLRQQAYVDQTRVYAIGWSYGAGGLFAALAAMESPLVRKAAMLYPLCRTARAWTVPVPALILMGALDEVTPPFTCDDVVRTMGPEKVRAVTYPDARHGFDARGLPEKTSYQFGTIGYNASAAQAAWSEIRNFLQ